MKGEAPVVWDGLEQGLEKHVEIRPANFGDRNHNLAMFYKVLQEGPEIFLLHAVVLPKSASYTQCDFSFYREVQLIGRVIASGFNVVFHDCDIVLLKDPIPHVLLLRR